MPSLPLSEALKLDDQPVQNAPSTAETINHWPKGSESLRVNGAHERSLTNPSLYDDDEDIFDRALKESTRPISRFLGEAGEYRSQNYLKDGAQGASRLNSIEAADFEIHFLNKPDPDMVLVSKATVKKIKKRYLQEMKGVTTEATMGPVICRTLNQLSYAMAQKVKAKQVAVFFDIHNKHMQFEGRFEGQNLRPGFVGTLIPLSEATFIDIGKEKQIEEEKTRTLRWSDVHTIGELKEDILQDLDTHLQIYAHMLPLALPNLAGMLMLVSDMKHNCRIEWSDTSGMVRTHTMKMSNMKTWGYIISYLYTLYEPRDELPFWDFTLKKIDGGGDKLWKVKVGEEEYDTTLIYATHHDSRQTCVFDAFNEDDEEKSRIIKDIWPDDDRKFKEHEMLEKLKGTPGIVQLERSQTVPTIKRDPETEVEVPTGEPLQTSKNHSGKGYRLKNSCLPGRSVPRRVKRRHVFHTRGTPLKERRSVRQIFAGIYDSVQGHQQMLIVKKILHRDVSRGNILLNPKHHGCKVSFSRKKGIVPFIPIEAVLKDAADRSEEFEESGVLTDLDCSADLTREDDGSTERAGTPKFIAIGVAGAVLRWSNLRANFPELTGHAAELYRNAYGEDIFRKFPERVNETARLKDSEELEHIHFQHQAYHDIESFYWVLLYELVLACPKGKEDEIETIAIMFLKTMEKHTWMDGLEDDRSNFIKISFRYKAFCQLFHPDLQKLAPVMFEMRNYLATEWGYWADDKLPPDHCHEAMKRLLLKALLMLEDDEIELRDEPRKIPRMAGYGHRRLNSHITTYPVKNKSSSNNKRGRDEEKESPQKKRRVSIRGDHDANLQGGSYQNEIFGGSEEVERPVKPVKISCKPAKTSRKPAKTSRKPVKTSRSRSKGSQSKAVSASQNATRRTTRSMSRKGMR